MRKLALYFAVSVLLLALAPSVVKADLLNSTINAAITLEGLDDNGFYIINVFTGPIGVGSGLSTSFSFFRQDTFEGFSTPTNQLTGNIGLAIDADSITLSFNGQAQPVELIGSFTNLPPAVTSATETDGGFIAGVSESLGSSFTSTSLMIEAFYLGFQPGTDTTQTDVLTFGAASNTPEPSSLVLIGTSLLSLIGIVRRKKLRQN